MYYIYYMRLGKKCLLDNGKYYNTPAEAHKKMKSLPKNYKTRCLIGYIPAS